MYRGNIIESEPEPEPEPYLSSSDQPGECLPMWPRPRRYHKKSKNGCKTCKIRKVKCDEKRPLCGNCAIHFSNIERCDSETRDNNGEKSALDGGKAQMVRLAPKTPIATDPNSPSGPPATESMALIRSVGAGSPDPFNTHPPCNLPDVQVLIHHYFSRFVLQAFPWHSAYHTNPLVQYWAPHIWTDSVLFHVTLQLSQLSLGALNNETSHDSGYLAWECIRMLRDRIQDPVLGVSDQTIGAVAMLATIECERGNMRAVQMHMAGLKRMIDIRGGIDSVRATNPLAANIAFWMSMVVMNEPQFLSAELANFRLLPQWSTNPPNGLNFNSFGIEESIAQTLLEMRCMNQHFATMTDYSSAQESLEALDHLCSVMQRLLCKNSTTDTENQLTNVTDCCRYSGALYNLITLRSLHPDHTLMINSLMHKVKACLSFMLSFPISIAKARTELLIWLLAVGGVSAFEQPERGWFVGHLAVAVTDLEIRSWDGMREQLKKAVWHQASCEEPFRRLWDDVVVKLDELKTSSSLN